MSKEKYIVEFRGILGVEYNSKYETCFTEVKDVIRELCFKLKGLRDRVLRLSKDGFEYILMKQGDKFIILPVICGADFWRRLGRWVAPVAMIAGTIFTAGALSAALLSTTFLGLSAGASLLIGGALLAVGMLLSKPPKGQGAESESSANKTSNYMGLEQGIPAGTPVPLGYGMILVSGTTIYASLNSIRGNVEVQDYLQESGR